MIGNRSGVTSRGATTTGRAHDIRRALLLEYLSLGYNVVEAVVGLAAGAAASSVALVGFGLDSVVESVSASVLLWRLRSEQSEALSAHEAESRAVRWVAIAFFILAGYVGFRALLDLVTGARPDDSPLGIGLAAVSLVAMPLLAARKRALARRLDSRSLRADSRQTSLCAYLSAFLLIGLLANSAFGWWWADPVAGLAIALVAVKEGWALWGDDDLRCC